MQLKDNKLSTLRTFFEKSMGQANIEKEEWRPLFRMLCLEALGLQSRDLLLLDETRLTESEILKALHIIKELKKQRPIQYILGECDFMGLRFLINESALIPRPETEELIQYILEERAEDIILLDVGTGSGCIAISLAHGIPSAEVHAMDLSEEALILAKANAEKLECNVIFHQDNMHEPSAEYPQFDMIVCNPPYITEKEKVFMESRVLDHEPDLALFIPDDRPLQSYEGLISFSQSRLKKNGLLFLEINEALGKETIELLKSNGYECNTPRKDIYGKDRFIRAVKG
jgi:release factor glutamine methyltransferase